MAGDSGAATWGKARFVVVQELKEGLAVCTDEEGKELRISHDVVPKGIGPGDTFALTIETKEQAEQRHHHSAKALLKEMLRDDTG